MLKSTWAPKGKTPCISEYSSYDHLSLIATISEKGGLVYQCHRCSIDGMTVAAFLNQLCYHNRKHKLALIWDGAKIHGSEPVKEFLSAHPGRIQLYRLPAYSPELNACELLWGYLKDKLANRVFLNLDDLLFDVCTELDLIKKNKRLIQSFFHHKKVAFFSN